MGWGLTVVTGPAAEPVTLAEAKRHLRVEHDADDTLIRGLIAAARDWCQAETQRQFMPATYRLTLDAFPGDCGWPAGAGFPTRAGAILLPFGPVTAVSSVTYYDSTGTSQTLSASLYQSALDREPPFVAPAPGEAWPTAEAGRAAAVTVNYTCGYAGAAAVPDAIKAAMLVLIGQRYEQRGDDQVLTPAAAAAVHPAVRALLDPYRTSVWW